MNGIQEKILESKFIQSNKNQPEYNKYHDNVSNDHADFTNLLIQNY